MIRINLLPFRAARKRENVKRQITIYVATVCIVLALMVVYTFHLSSNLSKLKDNESSLKKELAGYQKELKEIRNLQNKIKQIKKKLAIIDDLEKGKTGPVLLLSDIADAVPKDKLWLTSLSEKNGKLSLKGTAMDYETVSLFMKNLENADQIMGAPKIMGNGVTSRTLAKQKLTVSDFTLQCKTYAAKKKARPKNNKNK